MKTLRLGIYIAVLLFFFSLSLPFAQESSEEILKPLQRVHPHYTYEVNRFFIINRTPVNVFSTAEGTETVQSSVKLGQFFFGKQETESRVLLGEYRIEGENKRWTNELGWIEKNNLLIDRINPLTVGDAINKGLKVKHADTPNGLSPQNALYLRCVTQPERLLKPGGLPGDASGKVINTWTWYSVYDVAEHDGKQWILAGTEPNLAPSDILDDTNEPGPQTILLGWLPLEKMTIWASNLVIELNTSPEAVSYRVLNQKPAVVLSERDKQSTQMYKEPLESLWPEGNENSLYTDSVRLDPIGLDPDFPRSVIVQAWDDGFIEVASAASLGTDIKESTLLEIKRGLRKIMDDLKKVDFTFVVDATGSMGNEIRTVSEFLQTLSNELKNLQQTGAPVAIPFPNGDSLELTTNLNIVISLVSFIDIPEIAKINKTYTTRVHYQQLDVVKYINQIRAGLDSLAKDLGGGREALHYGLKEALTQNNWRPESLDRFIILLSDEKGDTNDEAGVLALMPNYTAEQIKLVPILKQPSVEEQKKDLTRIYSIFTGPNDLWGGFKNNVNKCSVDVTHIPDLESQQQKELLIKLLLARLRDKQNEISDRIQAIKDKMFKEKTQSGNALDPISALPGLGQLAILQALERAGLTFDDLRKLTKVAYYQGYVPLNDIEFERLDNKQKNDLPCSYRVRVMLSVKEVRDLSDLTGKVANGIKNALSRLGVKDPLLSFDDASSPTAKKQLICELVLLIRDQVTGAKNYQNNEEGKQKLSKNAEKLLNKIKSDDKLASSSLGHVFLIPDSLPFRVNGLLSAPLSKVLEQDISWFIKKADELRLKTTGLDHILNNNVIPEDFNAIGTTENLSKKWRFTKDSFSIVSYIYVPLSYIP
ncbi:MAG: hypothetical protein HQK65_22345 [Desulfamplus sp.]|nr:hypothetical protein [Desulfamplus sp.]